MGAFVRTVETGGFTTAARSLGLTPSALSKLVTRLEDRLGVRLLHRTTRRIKLTAEGEAFYARAREILMAMDDAESEVSQSNRRPRGQLRIRCGSAFGVHQLAQAVPSFQALYPEIELDITITDQPSRFKDDNFDMAISMGPLDESSLIARRICSLERVICASPAYLERHGTPSLPDELLQHNCLWVSPLPALRHWPFVTSDGVRVIHVNGTISANNTATVLQLAIAGAGIARLPDVMIGQALGNGSLVRVLDRWTHHEPISLYATYPGGRHIPPKVRAMVEFLVTRFANVRWDQTVPS